MAIVLDSSVFPETERSEAFHAGLDAALLSPTRLERARGVEGALFALPMGSNTVLQGIRVRCGTLRMARRSPALLRESNPDRLSLAFAVSGDCTTDGRGIRLSRRDQPRLLDLTSDYTIAYTGSSESVSFEVDCDVVGLTVDDVRAASGRVPASPLRRLVRKQLDGLLATADGLAPAARDAAGAGTAQLVRALILSVADEPRQRREAMAQSLAGRIDDYILRQLHDPDLTPLRIAEAHNISLRYLYLLFAERAETPAEWIIEQRLAAARRDLAERRLTVSAVAQRWGFKDHSHFTRRFKAAYGLTPTEFAGTVAPRVRDRA